MSVVSARIDDFAVPRRRQLRPIAVGYAKNDSGEPEPSDYAFAPQVPTFNLSHRFYKPVDTPVAHLPAGYVPVLPSQLNRPVGAANFWADTYDAFPSLDIEDDVPYPTKAYDHSFVAKFPDPAPAYPYGKGISGMGRPLKIDDISEPAGMMYYKGKKRHTPYKMETTNYDVGNDELKKMMRRY